GVCLEEYAAAVGADGVAHDVSAADHRPAQLDGLAAENVHEVKFNGAGGRLQILVDHATRIRRDVDIEHGAPDRGGLADLCCRAAGDRHTEHLDHVESILIRGV